MLMYCTKNDYNPKKASEIKIITAIKIMTSSDGDFFSVLKSSHELYYICILTHTHTHTHTHTTTHRHTHTQRHTDTPTHTHSHTHRHTHTYTHTPKPNTLKITQN